MILDRPPIEFTNLAGQVQVFGKPLHGVDYNVVNMNITPDNLAGLADQIRRWGDELGFQQVGFGSIDLDEDERHLEQWLAAGRHGTMDYMVRHGKMRSRPAE